MTGCLRARRVTLCVTFLASCLAGCSQTETARNESTDSQGSWYSSLPFLDEPAGPASDQQKVDVRMTMARSFEKQGNIDRAIKLYLDIVEKDDRRADAYHRLAVLHDRKGDCESSEKFYRAALEIEPDNPEIHCDFGYSYYLQRRWPEAETSLRKAIAIEPDSARAHVNLGLLLARIDRVEEAGMEFTRAGCPEAETRANLAFASMLERRWLEAQRQYEHALAADPQSQVARNGLETLKSLRPKVEQPEAIFADRNSRPIPPQRQRVSLRNHGIDG